MSRRPLTIRTRTLEIAYEATGPADGVPVILMHGFPDDPRAYDGTLEELEALGCRVLAPWLRGYGPTRFLDTATPRSGQQAALGADLLAFMDALDLGKAVLVGYDWGGRAACVVAALLARALPGPRNGGRVQHPGHRDGSSCRRPFWKSIDTGISGTSTPNAAARALSKTGAKSAGSFGGCGRQPGRLKRRRSTERLSASTTRTSSTSSFTRTGIDTGGSRGPGARMDRAAPCRTPPIVVPTVVLHGAADTVTPRDRRGGGCHARFSLACSSVTFVPNAGHLLPREAPDSVVTAVKALIG